MKMSPCKILLFVLVVFLVDVPNVWGQDSPSSDTVLRYESLSIIHKKEKNKKPDAPIFFESTRLKNDIQHKSLNVNRSEFKFKDCGSESSIIKFLEFSLKPDPVVVPGNIWLAFKIEFKETIVDKLRAVINKKGLIPYTETFDNICDNLRSVEDCPLTEYGIKCTCPFEKGIISVPGFPYTIKKKLPRYVLDGTYNINTKLYHNNELAGCMDITLTLRKP